MKNFQNQAEFGFAPDAFNLMGERGAAVCVAEKTAVFVAESPELPVRPAVKPLDVLCHWMGHSQRQAVKAGLRGEEKEYFADVLKKLADTINKMPATGETDGDGDQAVAHLHYFWGGCGNAYVVEKDVDLDGAGQVQAFGLCDMFGDGGEIGYISILDLIANGAELDFHWTPKTLAEIRAD